MASRLPVLLRLPRNLFRWHHNQHKITNISYRYQTSLTAFTVVKKWPLHDLRYCRKQLLHRSATLLKAQNEDLDVIIDVTYEEVVDGIKDDSVQMLDVRMRDELQQTGTIGQALNIPVQEMVEAISLSEDDFEEKYGFQKSELSKENLVVYCLMGLRATAAVKILHKAGLTNAKRYPGSWEEWVERQDRNK